MILGVVVVLAVAVLIPRLAGASPYTVLTGSMRPDYPPGTLVVAKPAPIDEISIGDVITYQRESGKASVVTHRVIAVSTRLDGEIQLTTQGDANDVPDQEPVEEVQVRGKLWYAVPKLGYVNNALSGAQRQTAVWIVSALLIGYAAFMLVGAMRDRRRGRHSGETEAAIAAPTATENTPTNLNTLKTPPTTEEQAVEHPVATSSRPGAGLDPRLLASVAIVMLAVFIAYKHRRSRRSA